MAFFSRGLQSSPPFRSFPLRRLHVDICPSTQKKAHNGIMAAVGSLLKSSALVTHDVDICTAIEKESYGIFIPIVCSMVQWLILHRGPCVNIRSSVKQQFHHIFVPFECSIVQWLRLIRVLCANVRSSLEPQLHHIFVSIPCSIVQWLPPCRPLGMNIRSSVKKQMYYGLVAMLYSRMQRSFVVTILPIDVSTMFQKQLNKRIVPPFRRYP